MNNVEKVYIASLEWENRTTIHPYHLGTDEQVARSCIPAIFAQAKGARTVALILATSINNYGMPYLKSKEIIDVWDGDSWSSQAHDH